VLPGSSYVFPFNTCVVDEVGVFGSHHGALQMLADLIIWNPVVFEFGLWILTTQLPQGLLHDRRTRRVVNAVPADQYEDTDLIEQEQRKGGKDGDLQQAKQPEQHGSRQALRNSLRSIVSTGLTSGVSPCHIRKLSAA